MRCRDPGEGAEGLDRRQTNSRNVLEVLGQFARDFALSLGAYDGVFIAGGIVPRYPELFENSRFRAGFESKSSVQTDFSKIPTRLISHPQPGLLGASYIALELFRGTEVMPTS